MQLNQLKPAWKQLKQMQSLQPLETSNLLALIDTPAPKGYTKLQSVLLNLTWFVILTVVCQGG